MESKLVIANNAISSPFLFFFNIIDLYFLILIIAQIFNLIIELILQLKILIKEAKLETERYIITAKTKEKLK